MTLFGFVALVACIVVASMIAYAMGKYSKEAEKVKALKDQAEEFAVTLRNETELSFESGQKDLKKKISDARANAEREGNNKGFENGRKVGVQETKEKYEKMLKDPKNYDWKVLLGQVDKIYTSSGSRRLLRKFLLKSAVHNGFKPLVIKKGNKK